MNMFIYVTPNKAINISAIRSATLNWVRLEEGEKKPIEKLFTTPNGYKLEMVIEGDGKHTSSSHEQAWEWLVALQLTPPPDPVDFNLWQS